MQIKDFSEVQILVPFLRLAMKKNHFYQTTASF